jgi:hypothetical protein
VTISASLPVRGNVLRPAVGGGHFLSFEFFVLGFYLGALIGGACGICRGICGICRITHDRLMAHPQQPKCFASDTYDSRQRTPAAKFVVNDGEARAGRSGFSPNFPVKTCAWQRATLDVRGYKV